MEKKNRKILVHSCCAACASHLARELEREGFEVTLFFFDPRLSNEECAKMIRSLRGLCRNLKIEMITAGHGQGEYLEIIRPYCDKNSLKFISDSGRLERHCRDLLIRFIIDKAIETAKKWQFRHLTTSMLCSPYRDHNAIWDIGRSAAIKSKLKFYYRDFRKGYWMGRNYAHKLNLAVPNYCSDYLE